jgi:ubiquinone/menaquinone biosynthesis C-methylase UbiE
MTQLTGDERAAYKYLPDTTENFVTAEKMSALMAAVGFNKIGFERLMFGTIAVHWAEK